MFRNRFLKYSNIVIGVLLIAALGAGYWLLYRPLPKTSGSVSAPVAASASAARDNLGIPSITAENQDDLLFVQGYATAQDRIFQMDLQRRSAAGELAEILGPALVERDRVNRVLGQPHLAERYANDLDPADRRAFAAYASGVNFFLESHRDRLPAEFTLIGYEPRPWRIADSLLIALEMFRTLSQTWRDELVRQTLRESGDEEKLRFLYPVRANADAMPGSNAWAISGARTASGKPLLAGDPHLEFSIPPLWYEVRLESPDLHAAGMTIPGLPGVIIGHNETIAWSLTNLHFDVQDLYVERLDQASGRHVHAGEIKQAERRLERILVRGARPVEFATWVTNHGPIVLSQAGLQIALRWTAAEPGIFRYPFLLVNRAGNWEEFRAALTVHPGPAQNFVYADTAGNIGYQAAGKLPVRDFDGSFPVDGASGQFEWEGFIPFDDLPSYFNPPSGAVISANENTFPKDYRYRVGGRFDPGYRARRIRELIESRSDWQADELLSVQTDIYDAPLHFLAGEAVAAYDRHGRAAAGVSDLVDALRGWDGRMTQEGRAPLVARLLFQHIRRAVASTASPAAGAAYDSPMAPAIIENLLRERPKGWFDDYDQLLLQGLADTLEEGRRMLGADSSRWRYGQWNVLQLSGGVLARIPVAGRFFRLEPVPLSGSPNTVQQVNGEVMPSMRVVWDLADWNASRAVIPFGQSGQRMSPHFRDQWETYRSSGAFLNGFQTVTTENRLLFLPER